MLYKIKDKNRGREILQLRQMGKKEEKGGLKERYRKTEEDILKASDKERNPPIVR